MVDVANLGIKVTSKGVERATKDLDKLAASGKKAERSTDELTASAIKMGTALKVAGVAAAGLVAKQILDVNRSFESLRASLITVTNSAEDAEIAFKGIQEFASTTPYSVQEVTNAFIKLSSLGLSPSQRALESYGNTAGAMGKSLNQMIEAVADAATGEFERLKEFGIKAASEGDRVTFTFRGVATEVGKNSQEIQNYLLGLGETEFAGGMERQAATLNGAISNLGDSWDNFLDNLLDSDNESKVTRAVRFIGSAIDWLDSKMRDDSPMESRLEALKEQQRVVDNLITEFNKPRLLRIDPLESTEDLGKRFDEANAKLKELRLELAESMMVNESTSKSFDDVAAGLEKVGSAKDAISDISDEPLIKITAEDEVETVDLIAQRMEELESIATDLNQTLRTPLEIYNDEIEKLNELRNTRKANTDEALISEETYQRGVAAAQERLEQANARAADSLSRLGLQADNWASSFADAMVDATGSFNDFADNMLKQLQKIAIQRATAPLFEAFGSVLDTTFGSVFSFAGGGFTGSGSRTGGVDGKGGFPAILHPNETVIDHTKGGATGGVNVVVNVDASGSTTAGDNEGVNLGKAIGDAVRTVLLQEKRAGGLLT